MSVTLGQINFAVSFLWNLTILESRIVGYFGLVDLLIKRMCPFAF